MLCCGSSAKDAVVDTKSNKKPESKDMRTTPAKAINNDSTPTTATTSTSTTPTSTTTTTTTTAATPSSNTSTSKTTDSDATTKTTLTVDSIISSTIANESKLHNSSGKQQKDAPLEKRKSGEKSRIKSFDADPADSDVGAVRESMKVDGAMSPGTRVLIAAPGDLSPNGTHIRRRVSSTTEAVHYLPTALVKPKGHRVRIEPSFNSKAVHLIVPPAPLLVASVLDVDGCSWAKVHPKMFPVGFKGCDTHCDGWTLIKDSRDEAIPLVFWKKAEE